MSGKSVIFGTAGNATSASSSLVSFPAVANSMRDIKKGNEIYPSLFPPLLVA